MLSKLAIFAAIVVAAYAASLVAPDPIAKALTCDFTKKTTCNYMFKIDYHNKTKPNWWANETLVSPLVGSTRPYNYQFQVFYNTSGNATMQGFVEPGDVSRTVIS